MINVPFCDKSGKLLPLNILFGQEETFCSFTTDEIDLHLKIPILAGQSTIYYPSQFGKVYSQQGFHLLETDSQLIGALAQPITYPLADPIALRAGDVTMKKEVCISDKEIKKR